MPSLRSGLVLALILAGGCVALWTFGSPAVAVPARWPSDDAFFAVPGWSTGPQTVTPSDSPGTTGAVVLRMYQRPDGQQAEFVLWTVPQPQAKQLYRKGPDRDFLGAGFTTAPAPTELVPPVEGGGALIAQRGTESWLLLYTFGERRGRLGDGIDAWGLAEFDALTNQPNDYFLARVGIPFVAGSALPQQDALKFTSVFDRLADWYARQQAS